ncbi:MAG: hypothetical protein ACKOPE_00680, partial [Novosphingobium sp.]
MFRLVALSMPLSLLASAALAQAVTPPPVMAPATNPGNLPCMLRMMDLNLMMNRGAKDEKRSAEDRAKSQAMSEEAHAATMYYLGLRGPGYFSQNRSSEGQAAFDKMRAMPKEEL